METRVGVPQYGALRGSAFGAALGAEPELAPGWFASADAGPWLATGSVGAVALAASSLAAFALVALSLAIPAGVEATVSKSGTARGIHGTEVAAGPDGREAGASGRDALGEDPEIGAGAEGLDSRRGMGTAWGAEAEVSRMSSTLDAGELESGGGSGAFQMSL